MSKENRIKIIFLHEQGKKPEVISNTLKIPVQTVRDAIKRYKEIGSIEDRPKSGRRITVTTPKNRDRIRKRINRNSHRSMRFMAKSMKISDGSVRKIVKHQLQLQPRKLFKAQELAETMKAKRLEKARKICVLSQMAIIGPLFYR